VQRINSYTENQTDLYFHRILQKIRYLNLRYTLNFFNISNNLKYGFILIDILKQIWQNLQKVPESYYCRFDLIGKIRILRIRKRSKNADYLYVLWNNYQNVLREV